MLTRVIRGNFFLIFGELTKWANMSQTTQQKKKNQQGKLEISIADSITQQFFFSFTFYDLTQPSITQDFDVRKIYQN